MKALSLAPSAFICFLVFGTLNETLTLVFDLLPQSINNIISGEIQSKVHQIL